MILFFGAKEEPHRLVYFLVKRVFVRFQNSNDAPHPEVSILTLIGSRFLPRPIGTLVMLRAQATARPHPHPLLLHRLTQPHHRVLTRGQSHVVRVTASCHSRKGQVSNRGQLGGRGTGGTGGGRTVGTGGGSFLEVSNPSEPKP